MATKTPSTKSSDENFESAMTRLEAIVTDMESDKLPLEELLTRYEEGVKLVKVCEEKLTAAEKRIEMITRNAAGEPQIEEFDPAKKNAAPAGGDVSLF
ncbi:MAG TPA: exodeoxyribonuclease VII small subunit [Chthoniobacter sp.]|jgi:exodeoxyribonuclease VII small subunit